MINIKIVLLFIFIFIVIYYLDNRIDNYDPNFFKGKVNGVLTRIVSTCGLGSIFFLVISKTKKILFFFLGGLIGLISSVISYLFFGAYDNLLFHIVGCVVFIIAFALIQKIRGTNQSPRIL